MRVNTLNIKDHLAFVTLNEVLSPSPFHFIHSLLSARAAKFGRVVMKGRNEVQTLSAEMFALGLRSRV